MGRLVGKRVKQVLAIVDELGDAATKQIHPYLSGVCFQSVHKYCVRAVELGLMTVSRAGRKCTYRTASGWRDGLKSLEPVPVLSESMVQIAMKTQPNSVFALGRI